MPPYGSAWPACPARPETSPRRCSPRASTSLQPRVNSPSVAGPPPARKTIHCAIAAWHGLWERPDNSFAHALMTSVANNDAPGFEIPAGAAIEPAASSSSHQSASGEAATSSAAPHDRERARQSPLFPVMSRSVRCRATIRQTTGPPRHRRAKDRRSEHPSDGYSAPYRRLYRP
jgi:hypothetical protein